MKGNSKSRMARGDARPTTSRIYAARYKHDNITRSPSRGETGWAR